MLVVLQFVIGTNKGDNIYVLEKVPSDHSVLVVGMGMLDFSNLSSTAQEVNQSSRRDSL